MNGIGSAGHSVINHSNSDNLGNSNIRSERICEAADLAATMIGTANTTSATAGNTHSYKSQTNHSNTHNNTSNNSIGVSGSQYCVLWNNYHAALVSTVGVLRREGHLLDCTLASTDGGRVSAHQLILAACSTVCRDFIKDVDNKHPIILLPSEIGVQELRAMVEFMYTGQVCIEQERLKAFIHGARYLRIKGLEDNSDDTDAEEMELGRDGYKLEVLRDSKPNARKLQLSRSGDSSTVTVGGDRRQQDAGDGATRAGSGEEDKDNWEVVERKPIILPQTRPLSPGGSRKRRRLTTSRRRPMHLSNSIVCYEKDAGVSKVGGGGGRNMNSGGGSASGYKDVQDDTGEPINKIRRMSTQQGHFHDDMEICTCSSRKTWSVADTEALLRVWGETLTQVPPSYFIRSMSLCKRVARNLQARGVHKNWRQCQVKMKNLRREVRLFKESRSRLSSRKPSEVANACEKLLPEIEEIFNKEEEIRQEWYQLKTDDRQRDDGAEEEIPSSPHQRDILARVAVLADSDLGDEDTDGAGLETEGEGGGYTEGEDGRGEGDRRGGGSGRRRVGGDGIRRHHHGAILGLETVEDEDMVGIGMEVTTASTFETHHGDTPHHSVHHQPDGTIHHIVEDASLQHH